MGIDGLASLLPGDKPVTSPIYIEVDGNRHMIGEATASSDGRVECSLSDAIEYVGNFSGYVSGFDFEIPVNRT